MVNIMSMITYRDAIDRVVCIMSVPVKCRGYTVRHREIGTEQLGTRLGICLSSCITNKAYWLV